MADIGADGADPADALGVIAAITTAAGFGAARPGSALVSGGIERDGSEPRLGSNRGDLGLAAGSGAVTSSRCGTSEPSLPDSVSPPPGSVGSKRPVPPNDGGVDGGSAEGCEKFADPG